MSIVKSEVKAVAQNLNENCLSRRWGLRNGSVQEQDLPDAESGRVGQEKFDFQQRLHLGEQLFPKVGP
jgi:hypothetical protein